MRALTATQLKLGSHTSLSKEKSKHGRAASEIPVSVFKETKTLRLSTPMLGTSTLKASAQEQAKRRQSLRKNSDDFNAKSQSSKACLSHSPNFSNDEAILDNRAKLQHEMQDQENDRVLPLRSRVSKSFGSGCVDLDITRSSRDGPVPAVPGLDHSEAADEALLGNSGEILQDSGASFDELVDRLLSLTRSKSDLMYKTVFLCLYRKFAAPSTLILAIIRRFEELNDQDLSPLSRLTVQLRYLNILKDWILDYPGDFAHSLSRRIVTGFVQTLASSQDYNAVSREISPQLEIVSEDDDTEWACSDRSRSRANTMESFITMSSVQSVPSTLNADSPTLTADSSTEDVADHIKPETAASTKLSRISAPPSTTSSISTSDSHSTGSLSTLLNPIEQAQRQARLLTPVTRNMLTKVQWHQLMEISEEEIARELTRIDWIMFSSIRPRDLIRHVSLPSEKKEKCKSLEHMNRMIHQFNHVAFWVTNMILLRDKPKHRAKALEKFMLVAWKLRYLNNYNSLGAVIAGINGTAVHRLAQTRELIPSEAQKQFMRLEILMGTQKSHFAYRLAFENTSTSRIPFLPLHRRDLVLAEQGNRTFVGAEDNERINWKKFEIMGDVIISIRQSQNTGYPRLSSSEEVQRLVLEGRFCKDDDVSYSHLSNLRLEAMDLRGVTAFSPCDVAGTIQLSMSMQLFLPPCSHNLLGTLRTKFANRSARRWGKPQEKIQLVSALTFMTLMYRLMHGMQ